MNVDLARWQFADNIFGAPLAMEGLGAFFPESTFLGLWLFGWDKLPRQVHLLTIWLVAFGSAFSALFIQWVKASRLCRRLGAEQADRGCLLHRVAA